MVHKLINHMSSGLLVEVENVLPNVMFYFDWLPNAILC